MPNRAMLPQGLSAALSSNLCLVLAVARERGGGAAGAGVIWQH